MFHPGTCQWQPILLRRSCILGVWDVSMLSWLPPFSSKLHLHVWLLLCCLRTRASLVRLEYFRRVYLLNQYWNIFNSFQAHHAKLGFISSIVQYFILDDAHSRASQLSILVPMKFPMKRGQERNSRICDILSDSRRIEFSKDHFVCTSYSF